MSSASQFSSSANSSGNPFASRNLIGEKYRSAAKCVGERSFKGYCIATCTRQLVDVWRWISIDANKEPPERHDCLAAQLVERVGVDPRGRPALLHCTGRAAAEALSASPVWSRR